MRTKSATQRRKSTNGKKATDAIDRLNRRQLINNTVGVLS